MSEIIISENQSRTLDYFEDVVNISDYKVLIEDVKYYKIYVNRDAYKELTDNGIKINGELVEKLICEERAILEIAPAVAGALRVGGALLTADSVRDAVEDAKRGDYFQALLTILPAIIPGAGKLLGKGGKAVLRTGKLQKTGTAMKKTGGQIEKFGKWAQANEDEISAKFQELKKFKGIRKYIDRIENKFNDFVRKTLKIEEPESVSQQDF